MPVLPATMQTQANEAAEQGNQFAALPPGVYTARLAKVNATKAKSSDNPMWELEFDDVRDLEGNKKPGRQWTNLVLIDQVMWKVGQFFAAFGVPSSVNTDELVGFRCRLQIGVRVITQGQRTGQEGNEVNGFIRLAEGDDGYQAVNQLSSKLGGGAAAAPAAAKPAAAKPAAAEKAPEEPANPPTTDEWSSAPDDGGVEF